MTTPRAPYRWTLRWASPEEDEPQSLDHTVVFLAVERDGEKATLEMNLPHSESLNIKPLLNRLEQNVESLCNSRNVGSVNRGDLEMEYLKHKLTRMGDILRHWLDDWLETVSPAIRKRMEKIADLHAAMEIRLELSEEREIHLVEHGEKLQAMLDKTIARIVADKQEAKNRDGGPI